MIPEPFEEDYDFDFLSDPDDLLDEDFDLDDFTGSDYDPEMYEDD